jgi:VIT family
MPELAEKSGRRILDPMERIAEVLFGLIMALTITCSFSIVGAGRADVRNMLIGAIGCNLAWGTIDAVLYWMACFSSRGQGVIAARAVRQATDPAVAHRIIADAMPPLLASVMSSAQFEQIRVELNQLSGLPERPHLVKKDWLAGIGVFLLVTIATLPIVLPFLFIKEPAHAMRVSNGIAIGLLFLTGYAFGRHSGHRPLAMGLAMVIVGGIMVGVTIALGG